MGVESYQNGVNRLHQTAEAGLFSQLSNTLLVIIVIIAGINYFFARAKYDKNNKTKSVGVVKVKEPTAKKDITIVDAECAVTGVDDDLLETDDGVLMNTDDTTVVKTDQTLQIETDGTLNTDGTLVNTDSTTSLETDGTLVNTDGAKVVALPVETIASETSEEIVECTAKSEPAEERDSPKSKNNNNNNNNKKKKKKGGAANNSTTKDTPAVTVTASAYEDPVPPVPPLPNELDQDKQELGDIGVKQEAEPNQVRKLHHTNQVRSFHVWRSLGM